ncbi:hypothetical protein E3N88_31323 [Mikania micrantha]|uniref:Uncharacterized protein n=1 Tax=Mikania micrantha TaxID=192012 RepID=A0A5N6MPZ8_9ASTR|nr:hypothetical protein E3N88_31323 [Mikania micrantha]
MLTGGHNECNFDVNAGSAMTCGGKREQSSFVLTLHADTICLLCLNARNALSAQNAVILNAKTIDYGRTIVGLSVLAFRCSS